jgi:hypothetical protein
MNYRYSGGLNGYRDFTIFHVPNISSQSVGSTFTLNSGPVFSQTVDFLTNGQEAEPPPPLGPPHRYSLQFWINGSGCGWWKKQLNGGYPAVDLRGFTIEGLDLRIDGFSAWQDAELGEMIAVTITFVIRGKFPWGPLWWRYWPRLSLYRPQ